MEAEAITRTNLNNISGSKRRMDNGDRTTPLEEPRFVTIRRFDDAAVAARKAGQGLQAMRSASLSDQDFTLDNLACLSASVSLSHVEGHPAQQKPIF